jgi:hypothetical protein
MKFYKYKQLQRCTFFGLDDLNLYEAFSCIKTSPQSAAGIVEDTKILKFNITRLFQKQLSQNAKIVIESIYIPTISTFTTRGGPITVRMNNINTNAHDSQNKGFNSPLIYHSEDSGFQFNNSNPELFYNFNISNNFFQNGTVEIQVTYPNTELDPGSLFRFNISFIVYDIDEEDLLLKDTPQVDYKNVSPHYPINNGRIPK